MDGALTRPTESPTAQPAEVTLGLEAEAQNQARPPAAEGPREQHHDDNRPEQLNASAGRRAASAGLIELKCGHQSCCADQVAMRPGIDRIY